jgi:hypothetical protein
LGGGRRAGATSSSSSSGCDGIVTEPVLKKSCSTADGAGVGGATGLTSSSGYDGSRIVRSAASLLVSRAGALAMSGVGSGWAGAVGAGGAEEVVDTSVGLSVAVALSPRCASAGSARAPALMAAAACAAASAMSLPATSVAEGRAGGTATCAVVETASLAGSALGCVVAALLAAAADPALGAAAAAGVEEGACAATPAAGRGAAGFSAAAAGGWLGMPYANVVVRLTSPPFGGPAATAPATLACSGRGGPEVGPVALPAVPDAFCAANLPVPDAPCAANLPVPVADGFALARAGTGGASGRATRSTAVTSSSEAPLVTASTSAEESRRVCSSAGSATIGISVSVVPSPTSHEGRIMDARRSASSGLRFGGWPEDPPLMPIA